MDEGQTIKRIRGTDADLWVEMTLLLEDLQYAKQRICLWEENARADKYDLAVSCFRDGVVTFVSCFDSSIGVFLNREDVYGKMEGAMDYFLWLQGLRDSWIAHRHGPARQAAAGVYVGEEGEALQLGVAQVRYYGPKPEELPSLLRFFDVAIRAASGKVNEAEVVVKKRIHNLPGQTISSFVDLVFTAPGPFDHKIGRKRFDNKS